MKFTAGFMAVARTNGVLDWEGGISMAEVTAATNDGETFFRADAKMETKSGSSIPFIILEYDENFWHQDYERNRKKLRSRSSKGRN